MSFRVWNFYFFKIFINFESPYLLILFCKEPGVRLLFKKQPDTVARNLLHQFGYLRFVGGFFLPYGVQVFLQIVLHGFYLSFYEVFF